MTTYDVHVCVCVRANLCTCARCGAVCKHACHGCGFACVVSCACVVCCAETSQSDASMHTAAVFCILVHPVTHTHDPSLLTMGCHKRTWQSLRAWGMLAWERNNPRLLLLKGERKNCWWSSMDNSCKGWSPNRRGPGRSSTGTASTPRFLDLLLASSPASQKSMLVGTSRSVFEARSISFACSLR